MGMARHSLWSARGERTQFTRSARALVAHVPAHRGAAIPMSLNLTGLADVAERSLQQITEIADDRRQTLDGAKHHAHVDVRLNELEESALSSLLMPMCAHSRAFPAPSPAPSRLEPSPLAHPVAPLPRPATFGPAASRLSPSPQAACAPAGNGGAWRPGGGRRGVDGGRRPAALALAPRGGRLPPVLHDVRPERPAARDGSRQVTAAACPIPTHTPTATANPNHNPNPNPKPIPNPTPAPNPNPVSRPRLTRWRRGRPTRGGCS